MSVVVGYVKNLNPEFAWDRIQNLRTESRKQNNTCEN